MGKSTASKKTSAPEAKAGASYWMLQSTFLATTGRSVHMRTMVTPQNEAESLELAGMVEKKICTVYNPRVASGKAQDAPKDEKQVKTATDDVGDGSDAENDLLDVSGLGQAAFDKLAELEITNQEELKVALKERREELVELCTEKSVAKWEAYFDEKASDDVSDSKTKDGKKSSRDEKEDDE